MNHNLEQYRVFYYVAKYGGITTAAEALSVSQPAVSQTIKLLEEELQVALFQRTSKGVRLTSEGQMLFQYVEKGYETILRGESKLREMLDLEAGEIRIGASDMTLKYYLLPYLEKFHEKYPKIKVTVYNSPTPETLQSMQNNKIDFGLVSSPLPQKYEFTAKAVKEMRDIFVAGSKFRHLSTKVLKYKELEELPIICLEKNTSTRKYVDSYLKTMQVELAPEFELATSDMIVQFALRNLGIGCVMEDFAEEALESGALFQLKFEQEIPTRQFYVVYQAHNHLTKAAQRMLEMLVE
ncbi:MAG TPA: LysR family transcriptional regulator [Lachnospiraceae bacterium]|nr:LysR family transcriptional regulator [Lachnospiraceae bacterium]